MMKKNPPPPPPPLPPPPVPTEYKKLWETEVEAMKERLSKCKREGDDQNICCCHYTKVDDLNVNFGYEVHAPDCSVLSICKHSDFVPFSVPGIPYQIVFNGTWVGKCPPNVKPFD
jgi:hypothetical protein